MTHFKQVTKDLLGSQITTRNKHGSRLLNHLLPWLVPPKTGVVQDRFHRLFIALRPTWRKDLETEVERWISKLVKYICLVLGTGIYKSDVLPLSRPKINTLEWWFIGQWGPFWATPWIVKIKLSLILRVLHLTGYTSKNLWNNWNSDTSDKQTVLLLKRGVVHKFKCISVRDHPHPMEVLKFNFGGQV